MWVDYKRMACALPYVIAASGMMAARLDPKPVYSTKGPSLLMMLPNAAVMPWL